MQTCGRGRGEGCCEEVRKLLGPWLVENVERDLYCSSHTTWWPGERRVLSGATPGVGAPSGERRVVISPGAKGGEGGRRMLNTPPTPGILSAQDGNRSAVGSGAMDKNTPLLDDSPPGSPHIRSPVFTPSGSGAGARNKKSSRSSSPPASPVLGGGSLRKLSGAQVVAGVPVSPQMLGAGRGSRSSSPKQAQAGAGAVAGSVFYLEPAEEMSPPASDAKPGSGAGASGGKRKRGGSLAEAVHSARRGRPDAMDHSPNLGGDAVLQQQLGAGRGAEHHDGMLLAGNVDHQNGNGGDLHHAGEPKAKRRKLEGGALSHTPPNEDEQDLPLEAGDRGAPGSGGVVPPVGGGPPPLGTVFAPPEPAASSSQSSFRDP